MTYTVNKFISDVVTVYAGFKAADIASSDQKKVYLANRRIHHGEIGVLGALVAPNKKMALFSTGVALHDIKDIFEWFRFKKRSEDH